MIPWCHPSKALFLLTCCSRAHRYPVKQRSNSSALQFFSFSPLQLYITFFAEMVRTLGCFGVYLDFFFHIERLTHTQKGEK